MQSNPAYKELAKGSVYPEFGADESYPSHMLRNEIHDDSVNDVLKGLFRISGAYLGRGTEIHDSRQTREKNFESHSAPRCQLKQVLRKQTKPI